MRETIAAIATAAGEGGIAVVRIAGPDALAITQKIFTGWREDWPSHVARWGRIVGKDGAVIDEVVALLMREGRSYTGEDTVEIMCHGGVLITRLVLARILEAGARAAGPGEFTFRAYQNGRIDLTQAEAVQSLIAAKSERALDAATQQLEGALSLRIQDLQKNLTDVVAIVEAWVDYPEEGLEFATEEELLEMLKTIRDKMSRLTATFREGKMVHCGIKLCLLGAPNVGKSSLMNALLQKDRAIVTPIAGTTRDLLEEELLIAGYHFRLIDTAGIRLADEVIEQEGIRRSRRAAEEADLILILLDASRALTLDEENLIATYPEALLLWNKIDLPHTTPPHPGIALSAKENLGLDSLKEALLARITSGSAPDKEAILLTKERHFLALTEAITHVDTTILGLTTAISPEFLVIDLRAALRSLATIIGTNITEDLLSAIFSKFCVGK